MLLYVINNVAITALLLVLATHLQADNKTTQPCFFPPALCRQKTRNLFFNKRLAPASPLPPHSSKRKVGKKP